MAKSNGQSSASASASSSTSASSLSSASSIKSIIAKDKLSDDEFDKLVIDTSHKFAQNSSKNDQLDCYSPDSSSHSLKLEQVQVPYSGTCDSVDKTVSEYNRLNQPKRPMNAFMVWSQAIRRELHHRFSNVQNATLSKALGRVWRSLDIAEKEPYVRRANLIKAVHKRDYPNYRYQPRRIQERRTRCNMLIGINLNHPVSQNPRQPSSLVSQTFGDGLGCSSALIGTQNSHYNNQLGQPLESQNGFEGGVTNSRREINLPYGEERRVEECRKMRKQVEMTVQTFEYQPYPVIQVENINLQGECRNYATGNNLGTCHNDYYHNQQCQNDVDKQMIAVSKQTGDGNYPAYQFNAFGTEHQQHYQYQSVPYEMSSQNNGYYV